MVASLLTDEIFLVKELEKLQVEVIPLGEQIPLASLQVTSTMVDKVKTGQLNDPKCVKIVQKVEEGATANFAVQN